MSTKNYVFYKFVCINDDISSCYVGSTANIKKRRTHHKNDCHNENGKTYNLKIYQTIRENGGWQNWKIIEFATRDNITKREAEQIEEQYRVELKADMNMCRAFRTEEQKKEYYHDNKEKLSEQMKEYYVDNKQKLIKHSKEWYVDNKEKLREKHDCECGGKFTTDNKLQHFKTKKHQKYINSQQ